LQICSHTLLMRKDLPQKCVSRKLALVSSVNWLEGSQTRKGRGPNCEGVRQGDGFETSFAKVSHIRFCFRCLHLPLASPTVARVYAATSSRSLAFYAATVCASSLRHHFRASYPSPLFDQFCSDSFLGFVVASPSPSFCTSSSPHAPSL